MQATVPDCIVSGTPVLFHGPVARGIAISHAREKGRLILDPLGDDGLKVEDSRRVVELAGNSGVGDRPPVVVLGPLDDATPEAADALLKTLEDLAEGPLGIILWANHLGTVTSTIQSRTLPRWCPPSENWTSPYQDEDATRLFDAYLSGELSTCLGILRERQKDWSDLLRGFEEVMSHRGLEDPSMVPLWEAIRPLRDGKGSYLVAVASLMGAMP